MRGWYWVPHPLPAGVHACCISVRLPHLCAGGVRCRPAIVAAAAAAAAAAVRLAERQLMLQWGTDGWLGQVEVTWLSV